jgi:outer membrane protein assembly factor BamA
MGTPRDRRVILAVLVCAAATAAAQPPLPEEARGWERPPPSITAGDVALFVPRVVLAVPRYALEVVFFPLRLGLQAADDHLIIEHVVDLLYNDARTAAILPSAAFFTGFGGTIGATAFHDDLFGGRERIALAAKFGGQYEQAYQLGFSAPRLLGSGVWIDTRVRYEVARGLLFYGIGDPREALPPPMPVDPRSLAVETRYTEERFMGYAAAGTTVGTARWPVRLGVAAIYNHRVFGEESRASGGDTSIEEVYDTAQLTGFGEGVDILQLEGSLVLDWRDAAGFPSSGVYLELFGGVAPKIDRYRYGRYGAEVSGYLDLHGGDRVLILRAAVEAVTGDGGELPFSELPRLGGPRHLRGYLLDRFRDRRAALGSVELRYPVHHNVMAHLFVDGGKVARDYDQLFDGERWHFGYGFGLVVGSRASTLFALDLAYGDGFVVSLSTDPLRAFGGRQTRL